MSAENKSYASDSSIDKSSCADTDTQTEGEKQPKLQCCRNVKMFTVFMCLLSCMNGSIAASYLPSVLTTIEHKFKLGSSTSGLIVSSYEIGATIAVIFVSFLGHHSHIPLILGWGSVIIGIGSAVFSLPHFISPNYTDEYVTEHLTGYTNSSSVIPLYCSTSSSAPNTSAECSNNTEISQRGLYIAIFIIAQTLIGVGSSPILTIGLTYIDNHVSSRTSSTYISFVYASAALGSAVGYGCGSAMLEVYIDFTTKNASELNLSSNDKNLWLGAWWAGFLLFAIILLMLAPCFCMYPKSMYKSSRYSPADNISTDTPHSEADPAVNPSAGLSASKIKELPKSLWKLMTNTVYMLLNLGGTFVMIIVTGFLTFAPKFIETQFYIKKSVASLITGGVAIPSAILGVVAIGYVIQRYNLSPLGAIRAVCLMCAITLGCFGLAFFVGCDNIDIAGITVPYDSGSGDDSIALPALSLNNTCNIECHCDNQFYDPICHGATTYTSYCHAGCLSRTNESEACSCTRGEVDVEPVSLVAGQCKSACSLLPAFLVLLAVFSFTMGSIKTPITMIILRRCDDNLKSFALGVQMLIIRLLALLPAPILYGTIIDSSCMWWRTDCGTKQNCIIHDNDQFRKRFTAVSFGFHGLGTIMFIIVWIILRKDSNNPKSEEKQNNELEEKAQDNKAYMTDFGDGVEVTKL